MSMKTIARSAPVIFLALALWHMPAFAEPEPPRVHALSMYGDIKYPLDFKHFDYAEPKAPKGGDLRMAATGTFDSLNPFIVKGVPAAGVGYLLDTLTVSAEDEPFTRYGLIAETMQVPADRSWIIFNLRPQAKFRDGTPITAADVVFTFETLKTKGSPFYRAYYADVAKVEALDERRVKFSFAAPNRELPLIVGEMTVLSKAWYATRPFDQTTLDPPMGSGPYRAAKIEQGRSIVYERDANYWGRDLAVNAGRFNFGTMRFDYYRDDVVQVEALKAGNFDLRAENSAKNWATAYDSPALASGQLVKDALPNRLPAPIQGFAFNLRRPIFQDVRIREALSYAFDFEWSNKTLFFGAYKRTRSYFGNSELEAKGLPSPAELKLLEPLKDLVPPQVFTAEFQPPVYDGSGNVRDGLRKAAKLLADAGWQIDKGKLVDAKGQPFEFEILVNAPSAPAFERIILPFTRNLERLGIQARLRSVDTAQYQNRIDSFDFDMVVAAYGNSQSPGNEQRDRWGSAGADDPGASNIIGVKNKAVDQLIDQIVRAEDRAGLVTAVRALDRVLQWNHYLITMYYTDTTRVVHWDMFGRAKTLPIAGFDLDTWWIDSDKLAKLNRRGQP